MNTKAESERKVRAAQGIPLPNVEAVGDGWGNAEENNRQPPPTPSVRGRDLKERRVGKGEKAG